MSTEQPLTRDEAGIRAHALSDVHYHVDLDLTGDGPTFDSPTRIEVAAKLGASTFVDLIAEEVVCATVNGADVDPDAVEPGRIRLPELAATNVIEVHARCRYDRTEVGCTGSPSPRTARRSCTPSSSPPMPGGYSPALTSRT